MTQGISPKLIAAVITAVITYVLGQELLALPPIATVTGQAILVALAAYAAPAGSVTPPVASSSDKRLGDSTLDQIARREQGLTLLEVLVVLLIVLIVLLLVGAIR